MSISDNVKAVREKIERAAQKSGRTAADITLVAVSKTISAECAAEAVACGVGILGENKVQELCEKYNDVPGARWHMIGHLQTNKVKHVVGKAELVHSLDSVHLAEEINRRAKAAGIVQNVLIQINLSGETTKSGISVHNLPELLETTGKLDNIRVRGFMTIGVAGVPESDTKKLFENCNNLFIDIRRKKYHNINMEILSMGMSGDFELAIECGSNLVRIGTGIFGGRNYERRERRQSRQNI